MRPVAKSTEGDFAPSFESCFSREIAQFVQFKPETEILTVLVAVICEAEVIEQSEVS